MTESTPTIAVLGLGAMGLPMAARLAETFTVKAFDVVAERTDLAVADGALAAATPAAASDGADVVLIGVRNQAQFESAMWGEGGATETLRSGAIVFLTSTIGTEAVVEAAARLAETGIDLLDAPVSGGAVRARNGDLLIMVGAEARVVDSAKPVLDVLASTVYVVGAKPGDGQTMKTVNQLLCGIHTAAAGEALALADKLGLDLDAVLDVLGSGAAASFMLADRGPRMVQRLRGETPELRSRLDIISKDMGIVHSLTRKVGIATPLASAAEQTYLALSAQGHDADDDSVAVGR
jgi:3-hydroxyisobutyrate dehydrogenase